MKEVSVVIPCWNREKFISRAIKSVLLQRYEHDVQIIVVDDASTDGSWNEIEELAERFHNIHAIRLFTHNRGPSHCRNIALEHVKHDHIAYLDSDDFWLPHHLLTAKAYFEPDVSMVSNFWGFAAFDKDTRVVRFLQSEHYKEVNTNCRVHTKECLSLGLFPDKRWGEDYDFFKRIEENRKCVRTNVLSSVNGYIVDGNNITYEFAGKEALDHYMK